MKKKWLSIFAVAVIAIGGLTACAEDDSDVEDQSEETTEETNEESAE
ncbi:hypothetical protein [Gracilibacillus boraciitolerans]|nr:hypothetical protein [Gracilibacillus boraciitolerans]